MGKLGPVKLNLPGLNTVMKSADIQADLNARAARIASAAGPGFESGPGTPHPWVARAYAWTGTPEAERAEATDMALTRAIDAGR